MALMAERKTTTVAPDQRAPVAGPASLDMTAWPRVTLPPPPAAPLVNSS
jgi:hypothetical protein